MNTRTTNSSLSTARYNTRSSPSRTTGSRTKAVANSDHRRSASSGSRNSGPPTRKKLPVLLQGRSERKVDRHENDSDFSDSEEESDGKVRAVSDIRSLNNDYEQDEDGEQEGETDDEHRDSGTADRLARGVADVSMNSRHHRAHSEETNGGTTLTTEYTISLEKSGRIDSSSRDKQMIRSVLPGIFQHIKFLNGDEDLAIDSVMARYFFKELRIKEQMQVAWWTKNKESVRTAVNTRRANMQDSIKEAIMCKYIAGSLCCMCRS